MRKGVSMTAGADRITLAPIGEIEGGLLDWLEPRLAKSFGHPVDRLEPLEVQQSDYDPQRGQYSSTAFLERLRRVHPPATLKILGITGVDLFADGLNFVFGEAYVGGYAGVISTYRLHPEYYGKQPNPDLFRERVLKEAIHELGHTFGLNHCPDIYCVMHYSNSIQDTDRKGTHFCPRHRP